MGIVYWCWFSVKLFLIHHAGILGMLFREWFECFISCHKFPDEDAGFVWSNTKNLWERGTCEGEPGIPVDQVDN
jgi:hypothetical protein